MAETSMKIILKMLSHGKFQVKLFQCDRFKSNDTAESFLQEKYAMLNALCTGYIYKTWVDSAF